jgi:two-component system response regulator FlrC
MTQLPILLVEDDLNLREALAETLGLADYQVRVAADGAAALEILARAPVVAVVTDYQMKPMDGYQLLQRIRAEHPQLPVLLMTAHGTIQHAVRSMLEGATDYLVKPFSAQVLLDKLQSIIPLCWTPDEIVAEDPATLQVLEVARKVAASDTTVLLTGASGTGKEVIARFIHRISPRAEGPFIAINCAAIPENMLEAVLFGHEKGAFTGAHEARSGKFEQAQGGTLLLDEISEMDIGLQAKLLRVLQEKEVERVGGKRSIHLDIRVLATSNRSLPEQVRTGQFREDVYYRLSVFPIELPALRHRPMDILPLAQHFIREAAGGLQPPCQLEEDAANRLLRHSWPGNVRELQNLMQRAVIMSSGQRIRARDLRFAHGPETEAVSVAAPAELVSDSGLHQNLQSVEGQLILEALSQGGGSRKRAAQILGISPRTLRYKIAKLRDAGIPIPGGREMAATS